MVFLAVATSARIAYAATVSVTVFAESGAGTLADAIGKANSGACAAPCTITFASGGIITIISSFLPAITAPNVTIDGYTAPLSSPNSNAFGLADNARILVALQGPSTGTGITVGATATGATIKGLAIGGFDTAISIAAANGAVKGNFIGTDTLGTTQVGNTTGVLITATGAVVGGLDADRNVISGNFDGIVFDSGAANGIVQGNYIGMGANVVVPLVSANIGVNLRAGSGHQIGTVGRPNLVNSFSIGVEVGSNGNTVKANRIGTSADGTLGTGGNGAGVSVGANGNTIGGTLAGEGNQISGNLSGANIGGDGNSFIGNLVGTDPTGTVSVGGFPDDGVQVTGSNNTLKNNTIKFSTMGVIVAGSGIGNAILDNVIALNSNIGIDLSGSFGADGPTPNDAQDLDPDVPGEGGNNFQNFPEVHSATLSGGALSLDIAIDSSGVPATAAFRFQTFKADTSGLNPQGLVLLDSRCMAGNKLGPFAIIIPAAAVALGDSIVMTATSYTGIGCTTVGDGTSEFSFPAAVVAAPLVVVNTNDSGAGSLRQAITDANACSPACTIVFNIPAPWPPVIQPASQLPTLTTPGTVIDGGTQTIFSSDANANGPDVILDGTLAGASNGLTIDASSVTIRDLVIRRFANAGIEISDLSFTVSGNVITGNYIGIDANGSSAAGNGTGILLADHARNNMIGGATAGDRNIISGNSGDGVRITTKNATGNLVLGNYIGTNAAGTAAVANNRGVVIDTGANNNHIGSFGSLLVQTQGGRLHPIAASAGATSQPPHRKKAVAASVCTCTPTPDNIISGNTVAGVTIDGGGGGSLGLGDVKASGLIIISGPNTVTNDFIGTDVTGNLALPNGTGVQVAGTTLAAIIGEPFLSNIIAFNTGAGVSVCGTATGTSIRGNEIHDNGGLGIDLNCDGVTPNDALDADIGPNDLTNFPVIIATGVTDGGGVLHALPATNYDIDVYASTTADPSGNGEGAFWIGSSSVRTDAAGDGYFSFPTGEPPNTWITLTATNVDSFNPITSEFSAAVQMFSTPGTTAAVIDTATKTITSHVFVGDAPQGVSWNGNNTAIVALQGAKLVRLDMTKTPPPITDTLTLSPTLTTLKNVAVNPAGTRALVTGAEAAVVYVDLTTTPMTILGTATLPAADADGIAYFAGGNKALVADGNNLAVLDLTIPSAIGVTAVPLGAQLTAVDVAVNPAGDRAALSVNLGLQVYDLTASPPTLMGGNTFNAEDARGIAITSDGTKALFLETGRVGESAPTLFVFDITGPDPPNFISSLRLPDWVPTAIRILPGGTAVIATRFGTLFSDPPYAAITTTLTDSPQFSGSATDSLDVNAAATRALNLNVDTPNLLPNISCTASLAFGPVVAGNSSTLSVTCTNTGAATLTVSTIGVSGTGFALGTAPATPFGVIPAGTFNYQVVFTPPGAGPFTGTATVTNNGTSGNANTSLGGTGILQADLSITKTDGVTTVTAGSAVTYTIIVTNGGPSPVTAVPVTDNFPATLTGVVWTCGASAGSSCGAPGGSGNIATTVNLFSGGTATFSATGTLAASATGTLSNTANVTVPGGVTDLNLTNNSATDSDSITQSANLSITKNGPASFTPGQNIVFTVAVTNGGPSDASGVSVSDPTPAGLTFVSNSGACVSAYPCALGTLTPSQTKTITTTFFVPPSYAGSITNIATVSATTPDPNNTNNTTSVTSGGASVANLGITKSGPANVNAGLNITYTINVTNAGPSDATGVSVSDPTPAGLTFVSNSGDCTVAFPCPLGTVTVGQTKTITAVFNVPASYASPSVTNTATVSATTPDSSSANNTASATTTVTPSTADVSVTKTGPATLVPGQNVSYTITVVNLGPASAANVVVNDPTPAGLTFVSNTGACATPFPCALGTLTSGQTVRITSTYAVAASATGSVSNTASASTTTTDSNGTNNSSTATSTLTPKADLAVTKFGPASALPGSNITFTITVNNGGPSDAVGVVLSDPTPAGLTFVSASGSGCTTFPCSIGPLPAGQNRTVNATYNVTGASGSVTNTASVTSSTADPNGANNSASATTITACPEAPLITIPVNGATNVATNGILAWTDVGAASYKIYFAAGGQGCSTLITTTTATHIAYTSLNPGTVYQWRVEAVTPGCPVKTSICATFTTVTNCPPPPSLLTPANGAQVASPVNLSWTAVAGATNYTVFGSLNGGPSTNLGSTPSTSLIVSLDDGPMTWFVIADAGPLCQLQSATGSFNMCNPAPKPVAEAVAEIQTSQTYTIDWGDLIAVKFEVDESTSTAFLPGQTTTTTTTLNHLTFQHTSTTAIGFYYRVRAFSACANAFGAYSDIVRVVIAPIPPPSDPNANAPLGSNQTLVLQVFIPGFPGQRVPFTAHVDKPWATVTPGSGLMTQLGQLFIINADPSNLPNGTWNATLIVIFGSPSAAHIAPLADPPVKTPVSISLVTPVGVAKSTEPPANAMIIPSAGHLPGINSKWQSDIRLANTGFQKSKYQLTFTPAGADASKNMKKTIIEVDSGATTALDDIVRNWYGIGSLGESANGVLEIRPLSSAKKDGGVIPAVDVQTVSVASSRTYNISSQGTLGQFIPAVQFSSFIGKATGTGLAPVLGLQQIAQSSAYRTNLGVVEGAGKPATVLISVFDTTGKNLGNFPLDLAANEQRQLNGFLADHNISVPDGRIEVKVTSGDGKITAYASVIDNLTGDPLLVGGVPLRAQAADHYVLPGVATLQSDLANWQSDVRIFNAGSVPQTTTLTYYPQNNSGAPQTTALTVNPGEVKQLDNALPSLFAVANTGGALHVTTAADSTLVVSGRTYNLTPNGTFGQFIPAVTAADAVGAGGRSLQILQVEESVRYRTNVGIAEVTGKPTTVELSVFLPDSKISPKTQFTLGANEFRQFNVIHEIGMDDVYNARIQVRVVTGEGKVAAYGSVIDMRTQDPTYVPAQ